MINKIQSNFAHFAGQLDWLDYGLFLLFMVALFIVDKVSARVIRSTSNNIIAKKYPAFNQHIQSSGIVTLIAHLVPAVLVIVVLPILQHSGVANVIVDALELITSIIIVILITCAMFSLLNIANAIYQTYDMAIKHPIKSYIQIVKIILFIFAGILIISALLGQSPLTLITGIGALTAILVIAFKDVLLGFVASIEIAVNDIIRIGDWITVPKVDTNGHVIEISLSRIKVQNFDKTVSIIPTSEILQVGIKNWRGMYLSGGRRIKRSIPIDSHDIKIMSKDAIHKLYEKLKLPNDTFSNVDDSQVITNEMLFRQYALSYLKQHPQIHQADFLSLVRLMEPNDTGLPIEIYCFTKETSWDQYETIQSDIFSHLLSRLNDFGLKTYQRSSDYKR